MLSAWTVSLCSPSQTARGKTAAAPFSSTCVSQQTPHCLGPAQATPSRHPPTATALPAPPSRRLLNCKLGPIELEVQLFNPMRHCSSGGGSSPGVEGNPPDSVSNCSQHTSTMDDFHFTILLNALAAAVLWIAFRQPVQIYRVSPKKRMICVFGLFEVLKGLRSKKFSLSLTPI